MNKTNETPLAPHTPRNDAQRFDADATEKYAYDHQHTKGFGPVSTCFIVEQFDDGYCKVITGPSQGKKPATAIAWSGCLTQARKLVKMDTDMINDYRTAQ